MPCLATSDLVALALGDGPAAAARHAEECSACRERLDRLCVATSVVRASNVRGPSPLTNCLTDSEIAVLTERNGADPSAGVDHVAECARCRGRLAAVSRLLSDDGVIAELSRLAATEEQTAGNRRHRFRVPGVVATLVAAGLSGLLLTRRSAPPTPIEPDVEVLRENAITATVAPRIVGPAGIAGAADSMRWTAVPYADRYRVRVFDRDGALVWDIETSDTVLPVPAALVGRPAAIYLWNVQARTGWDRWVVSEWVDLRIGGSQ